MSKGLLAVLGLVLSTYELAEQRRQSLPLLTPQSAAFVDVALEGSSSGVPKPTIPALSSVFDKLTELKLKEEKERLKANTSGSGRGGSRRGGGRRGRGSGGSRTTSGANSKGKEPAS